jgi:uncharacterized protein
MMPDMLSIFAGSIVGFVLGLLGGGGSIIAVPLLLYMVGVPSAHMAIGTSAVAVSLSALANLVTQARHGLVKWPCAIAFSATGVIGTWFGSDLALRLPGSQLIALFGVLMMVIGTVMLLRKSPDSELDVNLNVKTAGRMLPPIAIAGLGVGVLSGFFGIGGGFLIVPALVFSTGMAMRNAIATSLVAITVFGAATAANYAIADEVDWRIAGLFVIGGIAGGLIGSLVGRLLVPHKKLLTMIFAGFVILIGGWVTYQNL